MKRMIAFLLAVLMCCGLLSPAVQPAAKAADGLHKISPYLLKYMETLPDDAGVPVGILPKGPSNEEIEAMIPVSDPGEKQTQAYWSAKRRLKHRINTEITSSFVQNYLDENDTIYYYGSIRCITAMVPKYKVFQLAALDEVVHMDLVSEWDAPVEAAGSTEAGTDGVVTPPTCTQAGFTTCTCAICGGTYVEDEIPALGHDFMNGACVLCGAEDPSVREKLSEALCREMDVSSDDAGIPIGIIFKGPSEEEVEALTAEIYSGEADTPAYRTAKKRAQQRLNSAITSAFVEEYLDENDTLYYQGHILCVTAMVPKSKILMIAALDEVTHIDLVSEEDFPLESTERNDSAGNNPVDEPVAETFRFDDVKDDGQFYFDPVYWAADQKITNGTGEKLFSPDDGCTRAQVVTFLWRAAGEPEPAGTVNPFRDVKEGAFYNKAVLWAYENGITRGTSAAAFAPDTTCTRGQIVTFLYRSSGAPEITRKSVPFRDVTDGQYYADAVAWAVENGITRGKTDDEFSPDDTCTRAEVVTFLYRSVKE